MTHPQPVDIIQSAQSKLLQLQNHYRDCQIEFWALAVVWEATRFAWYVVAGDLHTARAKLQGLKNAIGDFEKFNNPYPPQLQ